MQVFKLGRVRVLALEPAKVSAAFDSDTSPSCSSSPCSLTGGEEEKEEVVVTGGGGLKWEGGYCIAKNLCEERTEKKGMERGQSLKNVFFDCFLCKNDKLKRLVSILSHVLQKTTLFNPPSGVHRPFHLSRLSTLL